MITRNKFDEQEEIKTLLFNLFVEDIYGKKSWV